MKKKYCPQKMIAKSRFKDYSKFNEQELSQLTAVMTRLIEENAEVCAIILLRRDKAMQ